MNQRIDDLKFIGGICMKHLNSTICSLAFSLLLSIILPSTSFADADVKASDIIIYDEPVQLPPRDQNLDQVPKHVESYNHNMPGRAPRYGHGNTSTFGPLIPATYNFNGQVINALHSPVTLNLAQMVSDALSVQGYDPRLNNYIVKSVIVSAVSFGGQAIIRIHQNGNVLGSAQVYGSPRDYNNLFTQSYALLAQANYQWPLTVQINGQLRLTSVVVLLQPINNTPVYHPPTPPILIPTPGPTSNGSLKIIDSRGQNVKLSDSKKFDKKFASGSTRTYFNQQTLYRGFHWIHIKADTRDFEMKEANVRCQGSGSHRLATNISLGKDREVYYQVPRNCIIESVFIHGFTPYTTGNRARVSVSIE